MEHSEIILIALILAIVFMGSQIGKVIALFCTSNKETTYLPALKTVIKAEETMPVKKKSASRKSATTTRKTSAKTATKKRPATAPKKTTTKKAK